MRKLASSAAVIVLAAMFVASLASAQPGIGITKTSPLIGTGSSGSPLRIGPSTPCLTNEILKWNGSAWACAADSSGSIADGDKGDVTVSSSGSVWNIDANTITGTELAITATNCGAGGSSFITDIDSDGNGTCTTETGDVSGVTANSPLSGGGSSGAITVGMANGDRGDITTTTGTQTGDTWTIDSDAVTYAKMQNVSATSRILCRKTAGAGDVEECTGSDAATIIGGGISGLTTGTIPIATSATAIGNSTITDNTSVVSIASRSLQVGVSLDVDGVYSGFGSTDYAYYIDATNTRPGTACLYGTNAAGTCYINPVGYQASTTQTRSLEIDDGTGTGAGNNIAFFDGATRGTEFFGPITFNAASNVGNELALSGTFSSNGTSTTLSNGTGDQVTIGGGELRDTGAAPSSFTCGTGAAASGGRNWFRVTVGTSPTATCAITFSTAFGATPTCSVTRGNSSARADSYVSALSSSSMTISNDAGATLTAGAIFHVNCGG